jgi:hypothetical protein
MLIALLLLTLVQGSADGQAKKKPEGPPKKGDIVIVKGCFKGSALESTGISHKGGEEQLTEPYRYRLTGDKDVLKRMKADHDAEVVSVTAELRTDLPKPGGARIGNSRITIGGSRGMLGEPPPPVPVLKVSAFESTGISCR